MMKGICLENDILKAIGRKRAEDIFDNNDVSFNVTGNVLDSLTYSSVDDFERTIKSLIEILNNYHSTTGGQNK